MNGGKSDASTSTDDVKDRPLCLFYFTHPFGVLSPEPPTITAAPPSVTRAFLNMEPISPFYWPGSAPAPAPAPAAEDSCSNSSPGSMQFELGAATVHPAPVSVVSVARTHQARCAVQLPRRDSSPLPAALFATDLWFPSGGSSRVDFPRRAPYSRILPPLLLPSPRDPTDDYSSDDIWPRKCLNKFSLPPIELPPPMRVTLVRTERRDELSAVESVGNVREVKCRRKVGVKKPRRRGRGRGGDVRRMIGCLMRRALRGGGSGSALLESNTSPALQHALSTIREAWSEPTSLRDRCSRVLSRMYARNSALEQYTTSHSIERGSERESDDSGAMTRTLLTELQPRPHASPGLMRRRYSVPETIMRKYRLAQQNSDSEECAVPGCCGGAVPCSTCPPPSRTPRSAGESPRRPARRDRELMRKSALLRRMWTRPGAPEDGAPSPPGPDSTAPASADTDAPCTHLFSYGESDALSSSLPTAKETPASADLERQLEAPSSPSPCPYPRLACAYEMLEVVVSESASSSPPEGVPPPPAGAALPRRLPLELDVDEYVSRVLVESLHSLSDRLESMPAGGGDRRLSVVEKEIKVRLQNAAVNTIVHLSPTSNHQIIFGNEELCDGERRDQCNNPHVASPPREDNNNNYEGSPSASPSPTPSPRAAAVGFDAVIQHDNVNRAVLQQIQMLFRDELRREGDPRGDEDSGAGSHIEISNVDVYLSDGTGGDTISVLTRDAGEWSGGGDVGVGAGNYFCDAGRVALVPRRCAAPRSASMEVHASSSSGAEGDLLGEDAASLVDSLDDPASPRDPPPPRDSSAAFFVRICDSAAPERARVAECMPDRIRQKLHRRHRTRELRAECARQTKVRQLRDELQRRRLADAELERRAARRERDVPAPPPRDPRESRTRRARPRVEPVLRPGTVERAPRRIYQKSEIHEGDKCIEILEILEYSHASRSSDSTPTDEGGGGVRARNRRSRIPVPVPSATEHMRLTGGHAPTDVLLRAPVLPPAPRPSPLEPRERSNSLRFKRVFDMIPEERAGAGSESAADTEEVERARVHLSSPLRSPPAPASPPPSPRHVTTRSAGTSPPSEARRQRISQTTMTSPPNRSAATSPWHGASSPREGSRERCDPARANRRRSVPTDDGRRKVIRADGEGEERARLLRLSSVDAGSGGDCAGSSSSEPSDGSLLCSLAPRWLSAPRRRARRAPSPAPPSACAAGSWSVTVAGSCRAALPADVEMRLRFPHEHRDAPPAPATTAPPQECACASCVAHPGPPDAPAAAALPHARPDRLTFTLKKEAQDTSMVASKKSTRKFSEALPDLEAYHHASRTQLKSSVKTRRGYSLHCWLPEDERGPIRGNNGLSVLGCAIIPELKPRVPTMSERDLTRVYTPRHYLRS